MWYCMKYPRKKSFDQSSIAVNLPRNLMKPPRSAQNQEASPTGPQLAWKIQWSPVQKPEKPSINELPKKPTKKCSFLMSDVVPVHSSP